MSRKDSHFRLRCLCTKRFIGEVRRDESAFNSSNLQQLKLVNLAKINMLIYDNFRVLGRSRFLVRHSNFSTLLVLGISLGVV